MRIINITPELYTECVKEYLSRIDSSEISQHPLEKYLRHAEYDFSPPPLRDIPVIVGFVINQGIQYDLPHTMGCVVVIPKSLLSSPELPKICEHEIMHVFFRYNYSPKLTHFIKRMGYILIDRPHIRGEITNPDTRGKYGLPTKRGIVAPVLFSPADVRFITFNGKWRSSTSEEIAEYHYRLPFRQNYHPEEAWINIFY